MKCYDYEIGKDTAGQPIIGRKCFCNTTACLTQQYNLDSFIGIQEEPISKETEVAFYKKVFGENPPTPPLKE